MKLLALVTSFAVVAAVSGCGKKSATETTNDFLNDATGSLTDNAAALAENQSDTMDEVATAINENGSGGSASTATSFTEMMLAETTTTKADTLGTRTCVADTDTGIVTVTMTYDKTKTDSATKAGKVSTLAKVTSNVTAEGTLKRVWTLPAARKTAAICTPSAHFRFKDKGTSGTAVADVNLVETENRTRTMSVTKAGKTLTGRTMKTEGTRSVAFAAATDASYTYLKTITTDVTRTMTITKPSGGTVERIKKMSMPTPLTVQVTRDATSGELTSKLITQGQIKAEVTADTVVVTTTFNNVKYDFATTNDNKCTPVSGTISGETQKAGQTVKAYTIDFGADSATYPSGISMKLGDAAAEDCPTCVVAKCDMD